MIELTDEQKIEYFQRSFRAVDGLWFVKVEERYDFDTALEIDGEVWKILPKVQARILKSAAGLEEGLDALREALETKLSIEGFSYETKKHETGGGFDIIISRCPWHSIMLDSGREHLSGTVGESVCTVEYPVWASEFGAGASFGLEGRLCGGNDCCILRFTESGTTGDAAG